MTEQIYCENIEKVLKNRNLLEDSIGIKFDIKGKVVILEGEADKEMIALEILEAMELGFSASQALELKQDGFAFSRISIKSIAHRRNLSQVRARVVGTERKAMNNIEALTGCKIALHGNNVGIIGPIEEVQKAEHAVRNIIRGSKHANVYRYLEEKNAEEKAGIW